jgi:hypothetical protein
VGWGVDKKHERVSEDFRYVCCDLNSGLPEYEAGLLPSYGSVRTFKCLYVCPKLQVYAHCICSFKFP